MFRYELTTWTDTEPEKTTTSRAIWADVKEARQALLAAVRRTDSKPGVYARATLLEVTDN